MKMVLLTNILSPYRRVFFDEIALQCKKVGDTFSVLVMSPEEYDREWHYEEYKTEYTILLKCKTFRIKHIPIYINVDLKEKLESLKPDIVIIAGGYMLPSAWKASKIVGKQGGRLLFWSESHLGEKRQYGCLILWIRERVRRSFYSKFEGFLYPGEKAKQFIECYAGINVKYYFIPNLIDNRKFLKISEHCGEKYEIRKKYGLNCHKFIMFSPMRLTWVKGLEPFMDLFVKSGCSEKVQLVVAGTGELYEKLQNKAKKLKIDLKLLGYHEERDIIELYNGADCFLMPSLSDPSPLSCVEAIWCGLPILVSEHVGNSPEIVEEGINGYVFSYENRKEAQEKIRKIVNASSEWLEKASMRSREIAQERFELKKMTKNLIDSL